MKIYQLRSRGKAPPLDSYLFLISAIYTFICLPEPCPTLTRALFPSIPLCVGQHGAIQLVYHGLAITFHNEVVYHCEIVEEEEGVMIRKTVRFYFIYTTLIFST